MNQKKESKLNSRLRFSILLSLTLGLAPFYPEPHLFGKIRWVLGGGHGMQSMDHIDLLFHSMPWMLLIYFSTVKIRQVLKGKRT